MDVGAMLTPITAANVTTQISGIVGSAIVLAVVGLTLGIKYGKRVLHFVRSL